VVGCDAHHGLVAALAAHPRLLAVECDAGQPTDADFAVAVDDAPAAAHHELRRYLTGGDVRAPDVAAVRSQLAGRPAAVVAPLPVGPVPPSEIRQPEATAVVVRGPDVAGVAAELRRRGHEVKDAPGPEVALVVETDPSTCELASVRTDMAAERVVIGLAVNPLLADTVRPGSDGILVPAGEALVDAVVALLDQPLEIARLGFEGRASVAAATWARVLRALALPGTDTGPTEDA
jgi:hypothetical protein